MAEIWTIGHSNRPLDDFLGLLQSNKITGLADVRRFPGSRRYPHFNREELAQSLADVGIEYRHLAELGGRRRASADSPNTVWRNEAFRGYADYMMTPGFEVAVCDLLKLAENKRTAIMCAEVLWWQCHRALISDYLKAQDHRVFHILGPNKVEEHPFTSAAQIVGGKLSYAASRTSEPEFKF